MIRWIREEIPVVNLKFQKAVIKFISVVVGVRSNIRVIHGFLDEISFNMEMK
ncbi:unnamed protein product [Arabis nemorensis]|uniref:Uncharacterized protein n=1 Tax=Arabis nemorensis TaxID=586526 RepID=A0A565CVN6_9BRAS|nr:unnamed protein product [Arabis nemorensis]